VTAPPSPRWRTASSIRPRNGHRRDGEGSGTPSRASASNRGTCRRRAFRLPPACPHRPDATARPAGGCERGWPGLRAPLGTWRIRSGGDAAVGHQTAGERAGAAQRSAKGACAMRPRSARHVAHDGEEIARGAARFLGAAHGLVRVHGGQRTHTPRTHAPDAPHEGSDPAVGRHAAAVNSMAGKAGDARGSAGIMGAGAAQQSHEGVPIRLGQRVNDVVEPDPTPPTTEPWG
jgi:hypothetical protein